MTFFVTLFQLEKTIKSKHATLELSRSIRNELCLTQMWRNFSLFCLSMAISLRNHSISTYAKFSEKLTFLPLASHIYVYISGGKKCQLFKKYFVRNKCIIPYEKFPDNLRRVTHETCTYAQNLKSSELLIFALFLYKPVSLGQRIFQLHQLTEEFFLELFARGAENKFVGLRFSSTIIMKSVDRLKHYHER